MGSEASVTVRFKGQTASGKARLETEVLHFRGGDLKLSIPFKQMSNVAARSGTLKVTFPGGIAAFGLGQAAAKWADKILHPPSRLQKIGVKPGWRACAIGVDDAEFLQDLDAAIADLSIGRIVKDCDAIFYGVAKESELARLAKMTSSLKPNGALWIIRPKGRGELSERAAMAAGKAAGLVDVKVIGFSPTHTAEKYVVPLARRRT